MVWERFVRRDARLDGGHRSPAIASATPLDPVLRRLVCRHGEWPNSDTPLRANCFSVRLHFLDDRPVRDVLRLAARRSSEHPSDRSCCRLSTWHSCGVAYDYLRDMGHKQVIQPGRRSSSAKVTYKLSRSPWMKSRMVVAFVSRMDFITSLPTQSMTAREIAAMNIEPHILGAIHKGAPFGW